MTVNSLSEMKHIELHASQVSGFLMCETAGLHRFWNKEQRVPHISSWIGRQVHRQVLDEGDEPFNDETGYVYDKHTDDFAHAKRQSRRIVKAVQKTLDEHEIEHVETEKDMGYYREDHWPANICLAGRADIIGYHQGVRVIIDLKTGDDYVPAWLQLGAYALLDGYDDSKVLPAIGLGVIHAPRKDNGWNPPMVYWAERPHDIIDITRKQLERIIDLIGDPEPTVSPGKHCKWCQHPDCAVRATWYHPYQ